MTKSSSRFSRDEASHAARPGRSCSSWRVWVRAARASYNSKGQRLLYDDYDTLELIVENVGKTKDLCKVCCPNGVTEEDIVDDES